MLPAEYAWFEPVLYASIVVFVVAWIGNALLFVNKFLNALLTAVVFALIFGALTYFGFGTVNVELTAEPAGRAPATSGQGIGQGAPATPTPPAEPPATAN